MPRGLALICACLLAPAPALAAEWVYDDHLTLALTTTDGRTDAGPVTRLDASARIAPDIVNAWVDEVAVARLPDGAVNPEFGKSKGCRVAFRLTRNGQPIPPWRVRPGAGPLADRLGVFVARVGSRLIFKPRASARVSILHALDGPAALYEVTWIVNGRVARTETLTLPPKPGETPATPLEGLASNGGVGIYPPGTRPGTPYPFAASDGSGGPPIEGAGVIIASLPPATAARALGLPELPRMPVLVGWQPDDSHCVSLFFARDDAAVSRAASLPPPRDLGSEGVVRADDAPAAARIRDRGAEQATPILLLAPGAQVLRSPTGGVSLGPGIAGVCVRRGHLDLATPLGVVTVRGLTLLDIEDGRLALWCVIGGATVAGRAVASPNAATWDGVELAARPFELPEMADRFLKTVLVIPDVSTVVAPPPDRDLGRTGVITRAVICSGLDARNRPVGITSRLPADTRKLTLFVEHKLPREERVEVGARLFRGDRETLRYVVDVAGSGKFVIEFRPAGAGPFSPGDRRIRLEVDGRFDREIRFTIGP